MSSINSMDDMSIMNTGNNNSEGTGCTANRENYFQNSKTTNYYIVEFTEIYKKKVAVEADSSSDAEKKIRNAWIEQEDPAVDNPAFYTAEYKVISGPDRQPPEGYARLAPCTNIRGTFFS